MRFKRYSCGGFAWLELLFAFAMLVLVFQLFPLLLSRLVGAIDVRKWSRGVWVSINVIVVLALVGVRFREALNVVGRSILSSLRGSRANRLDRRFDEGEGDLEARCRRDAEWRERARKRLPFT